LLTIENDGPVPSLDLERVSLLLDIDGTLLDIAPTPEAVRVPPTLVGAIDALAKRMSGAIGFVSGRTIETIDSLFAPVKLAAVGCHGAEIRENPGAEVQTAPTLSDGVRACVREIAAVAPGVLFEDKGYTFALHFRAVPDAGSAILRALMERRALLMSQDLVILRGKEVIEIKPRWFNKGTGLAHLMREAPFKGRTPVFLGDDTTDEDVFRVLPDFDGIGISVGRRIEGAGHMFGSPRAVRDWLSELAGLENAGT
jgi:trehalose 6-phosphate phosphatase